MILSGAVLLYHDFGAEAFRGFPAIAVSPVECAQIPKHAVADDSPGVPKSRIRFIFSSMTGTISRILCCNSCGLATGTEKFPEATIALRLLGAHDCAQPASSGRSGV